MSVIAGGSCVGWCFQLCPAPNLLTWYSDHSETCTSTLWALKSSLLFTQARVVLLLQLRMSSVSYTFTVVVDLPLQVLSWVRGRSTGLGGRPNRQGGQTCPFFSPGWQGRTALLRSWVMEQKGLSRAFWAPWFISGTLVVSTAGLSTSLCSLRAQPQDLCSPCFPQQASTLIERLTSWKLQPTPWKCIYISIFDPEFSLPEYHLWKNGDLWMQVFPSMRVKKEKWPNVQEQKVLSKMWHRAAENAQRLENVWAVSTCGDRRSQRRMGYTWGPGQEEEHLMGRALYLGGGTRSFILFFINVEFLLLLLIYYIFLAL